MQSNLAEKPDLEINYWPGPVARAAHRSKARVKYAWGALGTAKTSWLCWRVFYMAERAAKAGVSLRALILRDTYRNLADSTLRTWLEWFPDGGAPNCGIGYKSSSNPVDYRLWAGGRYHDIFFRHGQNAQDASAFLSTEYGFIALEEVAPAYIPGGKLMSPGISEEVFDMSLGRLRQKGIEEPELAMTSNSPFLTHWTSARIIDLGLEKLRARNWAHWNFPVTDNAKNLRPGYYEELAAAWEGNEILIKRFLKGERVPTFAGVPRFNITDLEAMLTYAPDPEFRGFLSPTEANVLHLSLEKNVNGYVRMWAPPKSGVRYVLGADVAEGLVGRDYSSAFVIDDQEGDIWAEWHGHIEPEKFGDELQKLGYTYNRALVGVESNNHGLTTLTRLKNLAYPNLFYQKPTDSRQRQIDRLGWRTDGRTKPLLVNEIAAYLQAGGKVKSKDLINELMTFGVMENGSLEAQPGCYDDRVISFGIALQMRKVGGLGRVYPALAN